MIYSGRQNCFDDLGEMARTTTAVLRPHLDKFDVIVVCGISGVSVGAPVSIRLRKPLLVVRKAEDRNGHHIGGEIVGYHHLYRSEPVRYLVLDDFIATGRTLGYIRSRVTDESADAQNVGLCQYAHETIEWFDE